ncbi:LCP family protein [Actinokineospora sp.]|uniref:LCP family protein n=1 Tax=Actinokineospora sp. TaxID=1872133 RepID=UPI003D6A0406
MRDDLDPDSGRATQGGKRRAPEPDEAPRRRRRSMEASGGVSVSDLVERHTGSRTNLQPVPPPHRPAEKPADPPPTPLYAAPPESKRSTGEFPAGPAADVAPHAPRPGRRRAVEEDPRPNLADAFGRPQPDPPRAILHAPIPADLAVPPTGAEPRGPVPVEQVHRIVEVKPQEPARPAPRRPDVGQHSIPMDPAPRPADGPYGEQRTGARALPVEPPQGYRQVEPHQGRPIPMDPAPRPDSERRGDVQHTGSRPIPMDPAPHRGPGDSGPLPRAPRPTGGIDPAHRTGARPIPLDPRQDPRPTGQSSGYRAMPPGPQGNGYRPAPHGGGYQPTGGHERPDSQQGRRPAPQSPGYRPDAPYGGEPGPGQFSGEAPGNRSGGRPVPDAYPGEHPMDPSGRGSRPLPGGPRGPRPVDGMPPRGPMPTGAASVDAILSGKQPAGDTGSHPRPAADLGQATGHYPPPGQDSLPGNQARPMIPRQLPPGQSSMPPRPDLDEARPAAPAVSPEELIGMTTEMEAIGEHTQKRRRVDQTLARFSKVHDELKAEERARKSKFSKLNPWAAQDAELDEHLEELAMVPGEPTALVAAVGVVAAEGLAEEEPPAGTRLQEKKVRKQTQTSKIAKIVAGTMAALVFLATGVGWGFLKWADDSIPNVRALDPNSKSIQNAEAQRGDENFLLVGSDSREGAASEDNVGDANQVPGARSDTMMIAHVPADRSRVVIVSFPRDLEIKRPECEKFDSKTNTYTGERVPGQKIAKMNTAYQVGGPLCATRVVQEISGLRITRFVGIDFNGFKGMVDAVEGVNVCVEKPMYDDTLKKWIVKDPGKAVELRGNDALDFVRARHVRGDGTGDYGRIKRQQRFLSSLLRKAMSGQVLLDPGKLSSFATAFAEATFGDNIDVQALLGLGQSMQGLEAGRVTFVTIPTVGYMNDRGNEVLLEEPKNALFRAIVNDQPLPGEKPAGSQPPASGSQQALPQSAPLRQQGPVDPKTLKIQVLNGGNTTGGIARKTADKLGALGYQVVNVNAGPSVPKTVVRYGKGKEAEAKTLASSVPGALLEEDAASVGAIVLIIGPEYKGEVVAPTGQVAQPTPEKLPANLATVNGGDVACA